jgi:kinesin family protein 15
VQSETRLQQKKVGDLELEIKKLSGQQNLQQRIKHHAKIKVLIHVKPRCFQILSVRSSEGTVVAYKFWVVYCVQQDENNSLRIQNDELSGKLRRAELLYTRVCDELAKYRTAEGKLPVLNIDEEQRLRNKLTVNFRSTIFTHALFLAMLFPTTCCTMRASCIYSIFILNSSLLTPFSDQWSQEVEAEKIQVSEKLSNMCTSIIKVFLVDVDLQIFIYVSPNQFLNI